MKLEEIQQLVLQGESETLEFKESTGKLREGCHTLCGFLNHKGGKILFGVSDKKDIRGQEVSDHTQQEISRELHKFDPSILADPIYINLENNKKLILIDVPSGNDNRPYLYDGRPYIRRGTSTYQMRSEQLQQLLATKVQNSTPWEEELVENYSVQDLDIEEIKRAIRQSLHMKSISANALNEPIEDVLMRMMLMREGRLINAAVVLFGKEVLPHYPQCLIKLARFRGKDVTAPFMDNQQVYGNAFHILQETDAFLMRHLPVESVFSDENSDRFARIDKSTLPFLAIREALINSICHRDYSNRAGSISLAIFDDRMEIWNNGILPRQLTIDDLKRKHRSYARNKIIAKSFHSRGYIETWGGGTLKIINECLAAGLPEPVFEEYSGGFEVVFKFKEPIGFNQTIKLPSPLLTHRQKAILTIINHHDALSIQDVMRELKDSASQRTVQRDLGILKGKNLIDRKGNVKSTIWVKKE